MKIAYVYDAFVSRRVKGGVEKRIYEISRRLVGIAERCGRHDLCRKDRVTRFVSAQVLLERGVLMGLAMFLAGFVFMLGLHLAGSGCAGLSNVGRDAGWRVVMVVGGAG